MGHHAAMPQLGRREVVSVVVAVGLLVVALVALALGAEAVSLALGAATAAVAFLVLTVTWRDDRLVAHRRARAEQNARRRLEREVRAQGRRAVGSVDAAELRLYQQLEALDWLQAELQLAHPLPPARGWAAAPDALAELVHLVDRARPAQVVELGSGVSTIVIARRLQQLGHGRLVALDHLPAFASQTRAELARQGLAEVATVVDAPLVDVRIDAETWRWYALGADVPARIDALFVDGPPGTMGPLARYPALPLLRDRLTPGAIVFVDDGDRADEQEIVRRWQAQDDGLEARHLPLSKGAWLLTVPGG